MVKLENFVTILINLIWIFKVSSQEVGARAALIVGGDLANDNQFPYTVSINADGVLCGGSIISKNYIVTAAHCVSFGPSSTTIRAGSIHLNDGGVTVGVSEIKSHPDYGNFNYDIALLKLSNPLEFNDGVQPIALATENPAAGSDVNISGWGGIYNDGPISETLKYNTLKALSIEECQERLHPLPSEVICFGHTSGNGICGGDSGGPAESNNQLVGVASYGVGGCGSDNPDGFTSIADLNQWIRDNSDL